MIELATDEIKVLQQLSINKTLKDRLHNASKQSGVPISRIVADLLEKYLHEFEKERKIQLLLSSSVKE